ncbi:hypothetical protein AVEN_18512-1 [Araneus ventricosus]|uniref:acid phosphatase n=1 Tax=Araneus ventricosus TaxID=182803 RepID=A0A4Y2JVB4_ARAVE|nr:hypothetical protein AVEN_18512-1 [Araneus ventricosus]
MLTGISALTGENVLNNHVSTSQPTTEINTMKRELMLIQMLFRHGHRAPFMLYPYDPNSEDNWNEGLGMLTKLGRLQHYAMGLHLQHRYMDFITTNPNEDLCLVICWKKIHNKILQRIPEKKVYIYSAHGSNIASLLLALDHYNWEGPPYASTIILELWKEEDEDYSIRWLYYNSTNPEKQIDPPVPLVLNGCDSEFCPLGRYEDLIRRLIPEDWDKECDDTSQKLKFQPFESPVHIPGLSSSVKLEMKRMAIIFLLLCVLLLQNNK